VSVEVATLRTLMSDAEAELVKVQRELELARVRESEIREERDALAVVLRRREGGAASVRSDTVAPVVTASEFESLPRTEAVAVSLSELTSAGLPTGPKEIEAYFTERGRNDQRGHISAALAYLNTRQRAHRVGRGEWLAGARPRLED